MVAKKNEKNFFAVLAKPLKQLTPNFTDVIV
jgi:hypothetical protein